MEINTIKLKYQHNIDEIFEKAWGCFGNKSLDEVDKEMNEMRQEWDSGFHAPASLPLS